MLFLFNFLLLFSCFLLRQNFPRFNLLIIKESNKVEKVKREKKIIIEGALKVLISVEQTQLFFMKFKLIRIVMFHIENFEDHGLLH